MKSYQRQRFDLDGRNLGAGIYAGYEFDRCSFNCVPFVYPRHPKARAVVRNVRLTNCTVGEPLLGTIAVEDCIVENLKTPGLFMVYGAVFKRVVLRGRFGGIMFNEYLPGTPEKKGEARTKALFARADEAYYEHVDWALDISEAEFRSCDFRYVPGHLVRRDPATQGLVWRDSLLQHDWMNLVLPASAWHAGLKMFMESKLPSTVLVAGKRHPKFKQQLEELKQLRELGIVEPD